MAVDAGSVLGSVGVDDELTESLWAKVSFNGLAPQKTKKTRIPLIRGDLKAI